MASSRTFYKDEDETLDFGINWSDWLGVDTISTSTWTVPTGLTSVSTSNTTTIATVFLSGGTDGAAYSLNNKIVTAGGRTAERTLTIVIREY